MGRKKKPGVVRAAEGNPGKRAIPADRPRPKGGLPSCPKWLDREAKAEWRRVISVVRGYPGWLGKVDRGLLADMCSTWSDIVMLRKMLKEESYIIETAKGGYMQHPAAGALHTKEKIHIRQLSEMGLTPTSRENIGLSEGEVVDEFTEFMKEKGQALGR